MRGRIIERISKKMGEKIGEKRCESKREIAIHRVRNAERALESGVKHFKVKRKKMSLHRRQADKDNYLGISSS